jgi:crossover junction endodeoxyribonuclease RuvC
MTTITLGIDPGLNRTGYAVIERGPRGPVLREGGVVRSTQGLSLVERILEIGRGVEEVFSHAQFPKTAVLMAHARGTVLFLAARAGLEVVHYTPTQIKRLLTGSGRADKAQMQLAIQREFALKEVLDPHDVADAAAVALCHYYTQRSLAKKLA